MITNIIGSNVCQFQNSHTPVNIMIFLVFFILYKMYFPCNVHCVLVSLSLLAIQKSDLLSNTIGGYSYGTASVPLFKIHELTS